MPFVIAISGMTGAGKTTLTRNVASWIGDTATISFDDYALLSTIPTNLREWFTDGADLEQWQTPQLIEDIQALREGNSVSLPDNKGVVASAPYILVEEPFGRERRAMAALLDFVVWIDLPLEVALARQLLRSLSVIFRQPSKEDASEYLKRHLMWYLETGRELYTSVNSRIKANCDLVIDGLLPAEEMVGCVVKAIQEQLSDKTSF